MQPLPAGPFPAVLQFGATHYRDGMVSVDGNLYSVPNSARKRVVEVHGMAHELRILEQGRLIAVHPVLESRGRRWIAAGHRTLPAPANSRTPRHGPPPPQGGEVVALRPLAFYDAVGKRLAAAS